MAEAATGTAWTPYHTHYPIKPGWSLATAPLAAAQGGWYGRKVPFGVRPYNMNDNILYHALATRSILRAFGKIPLSAPHGPTPPFPS